MTLSPNGFNIEHGISPDEYKILDAADEANGIDSIIERALEVLGN